jgi:Xaa-Pro aminopeptidase
MESQGDAQVKEKRVRDYMERKGLDAVVLTRQDNFAWFTCGGDNHVVTASEGGVASLVITSDRKYVVTSNIEASRIAAEELDESYEVVEYPWHEEARGAELIRQIIGGGRAASDDGQAALPLLEPDFAELRYSLTEEEMQRYRELGSDCSAMMSSVCAVIKPGFTEAEIAGILSNALTALQITPAVLLIAADERIEKYRHPIYTDNRVGKRVMLVLCGKRAGLICSLTRLAHFGKIPRDLVKRHEAVCAVDAAFILGTRVGAETGAIFRTATQTYAEYGFPDEWKLHHQGGPTGYAGRDYKVTPNETRCVQPNQAFAWNPSITGTKSEDTMLALGSGPEIISAPVDWPTVSVEFNGGTVERAAILEL